jgi:hypothetical protein
MINQVDNVEIDWSRLNVLVNNNSNTKSAWGFTLGLYINSQNIDIDDDIYKHESGHTMQSRILGPFYLTKVAISSFMSFQFGSGEYHDQSWYEVWANYLGGASKNEYYPRTYRHNNFWYWKSIICFPFSTF